jgi:hypothetical protein
MLEIGLASKRETNGRRESGRGQEINRINRQFHIGLVSLSTDGICEKFYGFMRNGIEL